MIKKILLVITILVSFFLFTGCTTKDEEVKQTNKTTGRIAAKDIKGPIVKANLDSDGNIVIDKSMITTEATYISYEYEGVVIGLIAVLDSKGNVKVVVNTCQSCGGSPYAYFVQVGDSIQCQNCGNYFSIDELDNLVEDGCNPIAIEDRKEVDGKIIVGTEQLKNLKDKFEHWAGPKA